ncbi:hypothetical protein Tco_1076650 [Tanacetum coccineum]
MFSQKGWIKNLESQSFVALPLFNDESGRFGICERQSKKNGQDSISRIRVGSLEQTLVFGWVQMCITARVFPLPGSPSVSCHTRNAQLYLDVFGMYSHFYEGNLRQESSTAFRVICPGQDPQLYLDVFKMYFKCCGGTSCTESTRTFKGTMLVAGSCHTNAGKRKLQTTDVNDPFRSYSSLCSSNAGKRRMVDSPWTMPVSLFHFAGRSHSEVFQKYMDLCATGAARNVQNMANIRASDDIGSSVSNRRKRTAGNSKIMLTPVEATTSKRTRQFPMINSNISARDSGESQRVSRRVNAEGYSSTAAIGCSYTYADLGDCTQRCRYCGASFTNLVVW